METTNLSTLTLYELTEAQYESRLRAGAIEENSIYLTEDAGIVYYASAIIGAFNFNALSGRISAELTGDFLSMVEAYQANRPLVLKLLEQSSNGNEIILNTAEFIGDGFYFTGYVPDINRRFNVSILGTRDVDISWDTPLTTVLERGKNYGTQEEFSELPDDLPDGSFFIVIEE